MSPTAARNKAVKQLTKPTKPPPLKLPEKPLKKKFPQTVKGLLLCAADLIEDGTHFFKGKFRNPKGDRFCSIGAIRHCAGFYDEDDLYDKHEARYYLTERAVASLQKVLPVETDVAIFNDRSSTTGKMMANLMRKAAAGGKA
jgi:hypothetical protein